MMMKRSDPPGENKGEDNEERSTHFPRIEILQNEGLHLSIKEWCEHNGVAREEPGVVAPSSTTTWPWEEQDEDEDEEEMLLSSALRGEEEESMPPLLLREEEEQEQTTTARGMIVYCARLEQTVADLTRTLTQVRATNTRTEKELAEVRTQARERVNARCHLSEVVELYGLTSGKSIRDITASSASSSSSSSSLLFPSPPHHQEGMTLFTDRQLLYYEQRGDGDGGGGGGEEMTTSVRGNSRGSFLCVLAHPLSFEQLCLLDTWMATGVIRSYTVHRYHKTDVFHSWGSHYRPLTSSLSDKAGGGGVGVMPQELCYGDYRTGKWYMVYQTGYSRQLAGGCQQAGECRGHATREEACAHYATFLAHSLICYPKGKTWTGREDEDEEEQEEMCCVICGTATRGQVELVSPFPQSKRKEEVSLTGPTTVHHLYPLCPRHQSPKVLKERLSLHVTPSASEGTIGPAQIRFEWRPITRRASIIRREQQRRSEESHA